jgi:hypothetical protein
VKASRHGGRRRAARLAAVTVIAGCLLPPAVAGAGPAGGTGSAATNVNMVGEAFTVRQDGTVPTDLLLARYPRAASEVSDDLSTGFAAFADPGFLGRFGIGAAFAASGRRELTAPSWAECLYPQSPQTPTAETRAPGEGLGPAAVADCRPRGTHLAGYATQAAPDGAQAGNLRGGPFTATVDTASTADGATDVVAASEIDDVTIGGVVTFRSIRNRAVATTTGHPGGAVARAEATIGALLVNGKPVALPSDSIEKLGPALAALAPVVAPAGTLTFDVVPENVEAAADGTQASARAGQITVSLHTGQLTVTFGLGYARAGARTIVNQPPDGGAALGGGLGGLTPPADGPSSAPDSAPVQAGSAATPADSTAAADFAASEPTAGPTADVGHGLALAVPPSPLPLRSAEPAPAPTPFAAGASFPAAPAAPPVAAFPPVPAPAAPATARAVGPAGPSTGTVGLLGVITAALLVRYLAYSTKFRRLEAAP